MLDWMRNPRTLQPLIHHSADPVSLECRQDIFQLKIDETYRDRQGAINIVADDITVYGKSDKEHDLHLHEIMERTGINLNDEKSVIKTKECNLFSILYTPDKIKAIEQLQPPKDKKELRSWGWKPI